MLRPANVVSSVLIPSVAGMVSVQIQPQDQKSKCLGASKRSHSEYFTGKEVENADCNRHTGGRGQPSEWSKDWMVHQDVVEHIHLKGDSKSYPIALAGTNACLEVGPLSAQFDIDEVGSNETVYRALLNECNSSPEQQWVFRSLSGVDEDGSGYTGYDGIFTLYNPSSQTYLANLDKCGPYGSGMCAVSDSWQMPYWFTVAENEEQPSEAATLAFTGTIQSTACTKFAGTTCFCLDLPGGDTSNGNGLWMWECYGGANQQWSFQDDQLVYTADPTKCVDFLSGDSTTEANYLGIMDCNGGKSQQWEYVSGKIRLGDKRGQQDGDNRCMDAQSSSRAAPVKNGYCFNDEYLGQNWDVGALNLLV